MDPFWESLDESRRNNNSIYNYVSHSSLSISKNKKINSSSIFSASTKFIVAVTRDNTLSLCVSSLGQVFFSCLFLVVTYACAKHDEEVCSSFPPPPPHLLNNFFFSLSILHTLLEDPSIRLLSLSLEVDDDVVVDKVPGKGFRHVSSCLFVCALALANNGEKSNPILRHRLHPPPPTGRNVSHSEHLCLPVFPP